MLKVEFSSLFRLTLNFVAVRRQVYLKSFRPLAPLGVYGRKCNVKSECSVLRRVWDMILKSEKLPEMTRINDENWEITRNDEKNGERESYNLDFKFIFYHISQEDNKSQEHLFFFFHLYFLFSILISSHISSQISSQI